MSIEGDWCGVARSIVSGRIKVDSLSQSELKSILIGLRSSKDPTCVEAARLIKERIN